jgi:predicted amidophosphoribosyltransferase
MAEPTAPAGNVGSGSVAGSYCAGCGRLTDACAGCTRDLDPPRFCPQCGRRLTVAVSPGGFRARCRDHGDVTPPSPE